MTKFSIFAAALAAILPLAHGSYGNTSLAVGIPPTQHFFRLLS